MKKILFGILTFLGIGLSFCNGIYDLNLGDILCTTTPELDGDYMEFNLERPLDGYSFFIYAYGNNSPTFYSSYRLLDSSTDYTNFYLGSSFDGEVCVFYKQLLSGSFNVGGSSSSDIDVYYNNGNSVENITCDGTQAISINGLSTITSTNTFTPYYNISYTDEDNQKLIESYSKDILYLENGQFKKTYTGNNDWILTVQGGSENSFSGYLPTFEITGGIEEVSESGNIFNNFAENSVKFTLSNIPSYIQYVILLFILFFILGFIRKFRRK